jgi:hypothetical protein
MNDAPECATLFRARRTAAWWRWDTEEGHGDPSRACIYLVPVEFTIQTFWDVHSGVFLVIVSTFRF